MENQFFDLLGTVILKLAENVSSLIWFVFALIVILLFYKPIRYELIPNLSKFKAMGMEFSFLEKSITNVIELAEKNPQWPITIPKEDKEHVLKRVREHLPLFKDVKILWIDDYPENNKNEQRMLHQLYAHVDKATSSKEALEILEKGSYDLIISDIERDGNKKAGTEFLNQFDNKNKIPIIFYIGKFLPENGVPPKSFGITDRPDELLHLTLDALERKKY